MFETWGERLGVTEDESDHACREGFKALRAVRRRDGAPRAGAARDSSRPSTRSACCCSGGPYHLDPGLHHGVPDEYQALGYPVLSMRSIPKDPKWLARFFKDDLDRGFITTPLSVQDVWPENYSTNSVQKVWAAKFAARHPNVVVLDLSSFKCGHDAPTYGLIDNIINSSGTPASALHDIDANKPGGSIKIRVKTYAHTLKRFEEELADEAAKRTSCSAASSREAAGAARGSPRRSCAKRRWPIRARARSSQSSKPPSPPTLEEDTVAGGIHRDRPAERHRAAAARRHAMVFLRKAPQPQMEAEP